MTAEPEQPQPEDQEAPSAGPRSPQEPPVPPLRAARTRDPLEDVRGRLTGMDLPLPSDPTVQHVLTTNGRWCVTHDRDSLECRTGLHFTAPIPHPRPPT